MAVRYEIEARPPLAGPDTAARSVGVSQPEPAQDEAGDPARGRLTELLGILRRAYAERLADYNKILGRVVTPERGQARKQSQSGYPHIELMLAGQRVRLDIDGKLYTSLYDLYVFHGPAGLAEVDAAFGQAARGERDFALAAWDFYRFTRNALLLVIRETLIGLELLAAEQLYEQLGAVSRSLSKTLLTELKFDTVPLYQEARIELDGQITVPARYRLHDRDLAGTLETGLRQAVTARQNLYDLIHAQQQNEETARNFVPGTTPPPGTERTWLTELTKETNEKVAAAATAFGAAQRQLYDHVPLALLVLPGLSRRFTPQAMEHTLATLLFGLANEVDRIADALQPGRSRIQQNLQGLRGSRSSSPRGDVYDIELAYSPSFLLEEGLIAMARAEIGRDPGLVVLLHDESWLRLISTGVVAVNSFEFAVVRHWLDALDQQAERAAARGAETHRILSLISASLSLIALVVPPLAPLAFASDLLLLSFMIYGAVAKLTALETGIQQQLPALASGAYEAIVAVGQTVTALAAYRRELAFEVVTQLAMLPVARIRAIGRILQSWAYVNDVYTLYQVTRRE